MGALKHCQNNIWGKSNRSPEFVKWTEIASHVRLLQAIIIYNSSPVSNN